MKHPFAIDHSWVLSSTTVQLAGSQTLAFRTNRTSGNNEHPQREPELAGFFFFSNKSAATAHLGQGYLGNTELVDAPLPPCRAWP